ncbi:acyl-CoA dehydrogenase family protein [Tropicimonas isoalkanivorans]|uniref:3-sulfinopropanoyl-CoA desulfinase n=1 Tax=Tropicimonas isoalkanivorans TaxID=441112 RepID=A0A1I1HT49_9RHOB|nr:acyl-CoA dehydrogenase family protein [Tropicimonas isoalkanivorans]SFC27041.1 Acyl-CoA dehydrogenase [Tropicimonas isoalkanivorans]
MSAPDTKVMERARRAACVAAKHAAAVDLDERFPYEGHAALKAEGLLGLSVPGEYGGLDCDARTAVAVVEEVAAACASTAALLLTWAGPAGALAAYGTKVQKNRYLPAIASGDCALSFALTEDHCGSDAGAIRATATRAGDDWVLEGRKAWIGNAINADLTLVAVKTDPAQRSRGVTTFLVDKGTAGVRVEEMYSKMGARGTRHGDLRLEAARVPATQVLGEVGRGLPQMLHSLDYIRLLTAAHALGIARAAHDSAVTYASERETFGQKLFTHQAIGFSIADCATWIHAARLITVDAATRLDKGEDIGAAAAMAKLHASETATRVAHAAIQVHGAWGLLKGNVAERAYRDARVTEIWDGTSEIQRLIITRSIFGRG